jgi:cytoskeletal protein CcmA (bactofilin family)
LDVDGVTTLDSLNAAEGVDFDSTLHVDGDTDVDGDFDVDGVTTLDSLNAAEGVDFDSTLNVDGATDLNSTLEVDGTSQFNDDVNVDATLTADTAIVEHYLRVQTPTLPGGTSATIVSKAEFAVVNAAGNNIFSVDGHNELTTIQNLIVTDQATWSGDLEVSGNLEADDILSNSQVVAGNSNYGYNWPTDGTDWNMLTRRDYVDFHRINQTDVPQFFSYDASLIAAASADPDYNEAVYYMNGNVVLYADSAATTGDNYTFTITGRNFDQFRDADGSLTNDGDLEASLWAENNEFSLNTNITRVNANTLTFTLGYDDVNSIVACTDGVVRPQLSVGTIDGGQFATGIYLFLDIVAPAPSAP